MINGTVTSGNFELGYRIEGDGAPALVIGSSVYYPRTFSAALRQRLRVAFVDHKGFAKPIVPFGRVEYELGSVLDDIELVRTHLALGNVTIIGHSGHGYLALEYAKRYPQNVSGVVMIATGPSHSAEHAQLAERHFQEAVCPDRKAVLERNLALLDEEVGASPERRFITFCIRLGARSWFDPHYDARALWSGVHVNMAVIDHLWGEAFRDLDVRLGLPELHIPVFIGMGRHDYLVAPHFAWEPYRSSFVDLTFRVFDRSSHTPQLEESHAFDTELLRWLAGTRSSV